MKDNHQITTLEQLRAVIVENPKQTETLNERLYDYMDEYSQRFIADSPVVFFATADANGHVDVSVKGDMPGFIEVIDKNTLHYPERKGNTDARNLRNILESDQVSLLFIIPRTKEVLRITGTATITKDPILLNSMVSCGKPAQLCVKIDVKECFFHCGRALHRSHMWVPDKWPDSPKTYKQDQMAKRRNYTADDTVELVKRMEEQRELRGETDGAF